MAKGLLYLASLIEKKSLALERAASDIAVDVARAIVTDLAIKTPVDTSAALSNWIVTLDAPSSETISPHVHGSKGSTWSASSGRTIGQANFDMLKKKAGQAIYITNNIDYISDLNSGSSRQEPAGFVERAVLIGRNVAKHSRKRP